MSRINWFAWAVFSTLPTFLPLRAQELVISTGSDLGGPGTIVAIDDLAHELVMPRPFYVAPLTPHVINPHGMILLSRDVAVASDFASPVPYDTYVGVDVIDIPSGSITDFFHPDGGDGTYRGYGTIALNPQGSHLLLASGSPNVPADRNKLFAVPLPLSSTSIASSVVSLPGDFGTAQTHGIVFDADTGRAYVGHSNGITAIDPPYASGNIAFTIALPQTNDPQAALSYAVALSPDKTTLLAADTTSSKLRIVHAPFSQMSTHDDLAIDGGEALDGIAFLPEGNQAIVAEAIGYHTLGPRAYAVTAPYTAASHFEILRLPYGIGLLNGFEDVAVSPDGLFAVLTGNGFYPEPVVVLGAPFSAQGFRTHIIPIGDVAFPYGPTGRGAGTARFWTEPATLPPQMTIDRVSILEGDSGTTAAALTVTLSKPTAQTVRVDYATSNATAQADVDYVPTSGTLTFSPGEISHTITVRVIGNTTSRGFAQNLWFRVKLQNAVNASVLQEPGYDYATPGRCTIVDDDRGRITTPSPLPDAFVGAAYSVTFTATDLAGAPSWSVTTDSRPPGLTMNDATGELSGTPTTETIAGDVISGYVFVDVAGGGGSVQGREYRLTIRRDSIFDDGFEAPTPPRPALLMESSQRGIKYAPSPDRAGALHPVLRTKQPQVWAR